MRRQPFVRLGPPALWLGGCLACAAVTVAAGPGSHGEEASHCGPLSLYLLLRIEGRDLDLGRVAHALPPAASAGHSMLQLREAGRALGLDLMAHRFQASRSRLDRPAIAYLEREGEGHFVVLRPVGRSGRLVQVIDSIREVESLDSADLPTIPGWTGHVLVPRRGGRWVVGSLLLAVPAAAVALRAALAKLRPRAGAAAA